MKRFAHLFSELDQTTRTTAKVAAMADYFQAAPPEDAAWAVFFLSGRRIRRTLAAGKLAGWAAEYAGMSDWLFSECYDAVGDLAETITLLLSQLQDADTDRDPQPLHWWVEDWLLPLQHTDEEHQRISLRRAWQSLPEEQLFVLHKLLTGGFRVGVSQKLVTRALADVAGIEPKVIAHRLMGDWGPSADFFAKLLSPDASDADRSRPYPFFLAHPLEQPPQELGESHCWQAEWKWDGIRAQLVSRNGEAYLWSRGEELMTGTFPEVETAAARLPDGCVLDGEIIAWNLEADRPLPFLELQSRINRKSVSPSLMQKTPVLFLAFDLLEWQGDDYRDEPLETRREQLSKVVADARENRLRLSPVVNIESWEQLADLRQESRDRGTEGLMLKRKGSGYGVGRTRGDWWKWKIEPYTIDCVLIYAQRGSGRRASLYTDYTFAVWDGDELVPFAKAYSGLTDAEIQEVDRFVRDHTAESFGPVRSVTAELVFELAFENIQRSSRHRSGIAVRFPRILRWRRDKKIEDADSLESIAAMLPAEKPPAQQTFDFD